MTDYSQLVKRLRQATDGFIHHEAADALEAQAKEIAELEKENRILRDEHKAVNQELTEMQGKYESARAADKTLRKALEASVTFVKHVKQFLYINDYGEYGLDDGFEDNADETIKIANAALKGERG